MSEQTTFTEADRNDGVEPDMVDQNGCARNREAAPPVRPSSP